MGGDVLLYRSLAGVCRGDPTRETGHEQSPDAWDRAQSLPPAALVWPLQTKVDYGLQGQGHGGPHHGTVGPVPGQWKRRGDLHTRYNYVDNTLEQKNEENDENGLSRNSRENRISVEGQPNISNSLAR